MRSIRRQTRRAGRFVAGAARLALVAMVLFANTACIDFGSLIGPVVGQTDKAIATLDDAIRALENASADWQQILQDTVAGLEQAGQRTIRDEVSDLLNRGIGAAGSEFRCNADFVRNRMRQELMRIKARLLGGDLPVLEPVFCDVVPLAIDRARVPASLNRVDFFGYDLDKQGLQVLLVRANGSSTDVTDRLDRPTHYHMTLNLGANGAQLGPDSQRFLMKWQDRELGTIGIIQPTTPVCQARRITFSPNPVTFVPPHTKGDREFNGHGPNVGVGVTLLNRRTHVEAKIEMTATETRSDWTTASGSVVERIYPGESGWEVRQIVGAATDAASYTDNDTVDDQLSRPSGGPVLRYTISGDGPGNDAGINTKVIVQFNPLQLLLEQTANCVSPLAVKGLQADLLAGRVMVNQDTLARLTPQLETLPADVRVIDGRFFPGGIVARRP